LSFYHLYKICNRFSFKTTCVDDGKPVRRELDELKKKNDRFHDAKRIFRNRWSHAQLCFPLQKSVTELLGEAALRDFIILRVIESVSRVSGFEETLKESNNIEEVFDKFAKLLKKSLIVTDVKPEINNGEFTIKLENCLLAKRSHAIAGNEGICPMAMSVAAMIRKILNKPIEIVSSSLLPNGSITKIRVLED